MAHAGGHRSDGRPEQGPDLFAGLWSQEMVVRFAEHRREHPDVYHALRDLAREAVRRGRNRIGIAALFEIVRWERGGISKDASGFKLNNDLRAMYARALMDENPDLAGLFETRRLRSSD